MATAKTAARAYAPDQGSAFLMTVVSTQVNSERAVPAERSIPPERMTAACPIVIRMRGAKALMFRTIDLVSKKFCWRIAVRANMITRMSRVENSGLEKNLRAAPRVAVSCACFTESPSYRTRIDVATIASSVMSAPSRVATICPSYMIMSRSQYWISSSLSLA